MDNKYVWLIGGIVITYFYCKHKTKKEVQAAVVEKVDKAVDVLTKEIHEDFNKAIDSAQVQGFSLDQLKQLINAY